jgi:hypothetical protein
VLPLRGPPPAQAPAAPAVAALVFGAEQVLFDAFVVDWQLVAAEGEQR